MDLLSFLFYFLFTQNVGAWESTSTTLRSVAFTSEAASVISTSTKPSPPPTASSSSAANIITSSSPAAIAAGSASSMLSRSSRSSEPSSLVMLTPVVPPTPLFVNESFIVFCTTITAAAMAPAADAATAAKLPPPDIATKWIDPKGKVRDNSKGRVHIENRAGSLALVFKHLALEDRGNWTCEASVPKGAKERKAFELSVNQKISFDKVEMIQSALDGRDATVYCKVIAEPAPTVTWLFNGEVIPVNNGSQTAGKYVAFSEGLVIKDVTQADAGEYTCRAMRITSTFADSDQITILLRIKHKPYWLDPNRPETQHAYIGGTVNISCDAMGEPPPSFTWLHNDDVITGRNYRRFDADYGSTLQVHVLNESNFGDYKCKAENMLGTLRRSTKLLRGQKPASPSRFQLKRAFTDGFELDIRSVKLTSVEENMQTFGYRVDYMSEKELKFNEGNWSYAKRKEFLFHRDGRRFVISGLKPNTTYLMRAASRNLAGISDWSAVKIFATLENFASRSVAFVTRHVIIIVVLGLTVNAALRHF